MAIQVKSLSYSTVSQFINCPDRVWMEKIERIPRRGGMSVKALFGVALHCAVASFYRAFLQRTSLSLDTLIRTFRIRFESIPVQADPENPVEELLEKAKQLLSMFVELEPPKSIISIERPYRFMLTSRLEAVCCPDVIVRDVNNVLTIIDWKSSTKKYAPDQVRKVTEQTLVYGMRFNELIKSRTLLFLRKKKCEILDLELNPDEVNPQEIIQKFSNVQKALENQIHFKNRGWWCAGCPYGYICNEPVSLEQEEERVMVA
jgi:CRISPR/Cas system-associated exonuclease Cas4 (RecB family)